MRLSNNWKIDENIQNLGKGRAIKSLNNFVFLTSNNVLSFKIIVGEKMFEYFHVSFKSVMGETGCHFPQLSVKLLC